MISFIIRRVLRLIPTIIIISIVSFIVIQLPPGDFLTSLLAQLAETGAAADTQAIEMLRHRYGLDQPIYVQYLKWIGGCLQGDFGYSFEWNRPVGELIFGRLVLTMVMSISALLFMWLVAIPIGIFSATHQYSVADHGLTLLGFIGLSVPNFMLALILMFIAFYWFGASVGGLFSPEYLEAPWSLARVVDMLKHLWIPVIVIGTAGTAQLIRIMRGNLLDILGQQYITTARAKGLKERIVIYKYAVRIAINPLISVMGMQMPEIISGATITAIVLSLPTTGPLFMRALICQDMYLAGTFLMFLSGLLLIGNLLADILLAWADPRIRYD